MQCTTREDSALPKIGNQQIRYGVVKVRTPRLVVPGATVDGADQSF